VLDFLGEKGSEQPWSTSVSLSAKLPSANRNSEGSFVAFFTSLFLIP